MLLQANGADQLVSLDTGIITIGTDKYAKIGLQNDKDRIVVPSIFFLRSGSNDLYDFITLVIDDVTLSCPYNFTATLVDQASSHADDTTYYYVITAYNALGETGVSREVTITIPDNTKSVQLSWVAIPNASGYKVYRGTISGSHAILSQIADQSINSLIDTGTGTGAYAPPVENTTAGSSPEYGSEPGVGYATTLSLGNINIGQQKFFWIRIAPDDTKTEDGNPRNCILKITE